MLGGSMYGGCCLLHGYHAIKQVTEAKDHAKICTFKVEEATKAEEETTVERAEEAVMRALAKDPDHRYASAAAFGEALEAVGRGAVAAPQQAPQAQQPLSQPIFTGPGRGAPQAAGQPSPQPTPPAQQPMPQGQQPAPRVPSQQPAPAPSKLPWVVFGAGVLLAIGGAVALIVALTR